MHNNLYILKFWNVLASKLFAMPAPKEKDLQNLF